MVLGRTIGDTGTEKQGLWQSHNSPRDPLGHLCSYRVSPQGPAICVTRLEVPILPSLGMVLGRVSAPSWIPFPNTNSWNSWPWPETMERIYLESIPELLTQFKSKEVLRKSAADPPRTVLFPSGSISQALNAQSSSVSSKPAAGPTFCQVHPLIPPSFYSILLF